MPSPFTQQTATSLATRTTVTLTVPASSAGGSGVVFLASNAAAAPGTTGISGGGTWSKVASGTPNGVGRYVEAWVNFALTVGTTSLVLTNTTSAPVVWSYLEVPNVSAVDLVSAVEAAANAATTVPVNLTPASANDIGASYVHWNTNTTAGISQSSSGWTTTVGTVDTAGNLAYIVNPTAGVSTGVTWSAGSSQGYGQVAIFLVQFAQATAALTVTGGATSSTASSGSLSISGSGTGSSTSSGSTAITGSAGASSTSSGSIAISGGAQSSATASGSVAVTGTAPGRAAATAAGTVAVTGSAQASTTAAGSVAVTGLATPPGPTGIGSVSITGSGLTAAASTSAGAVAVAGAANGAAAPTASGNVALTGAGSGSAHPTAAGVLALLGAANAKANATAVATLQLLGAGAVTARSTAAGQLQITGAGTALTRLPAPIAVTVGAPSGSRFTVETLSGSRFTVGAPSGTRFSVATLEK
jgi:hypothetical protein